MSLRFLPSVLVSVLACSAWADLQLVSPRCESAVNPIGVVRRAPRFTWALRGTEPDIRPAGAELRLASCRDDVSAGRRILWTKRASDCFACLYDGAPLKSGTPYWWQVRLVRDDGAAATDWSAPQRFVLARTADEWDGARWIGEKPYEVHWRDFDYQVKVSRIKKAFGLCFRTANGTATGDRDGYMWQINVEGAAPRLRPHVFKNGGMRILPAVDMGAFFPKGFDAAKEHVVKIAVRGTEIRTWVDGVCVDTRRDDTFTAGTIGVRGSSGEEALISELSVTAADGTRLLFDRFSGHIMPAFHHPKLKEGKLRVADGCAYHPGIIPKNAPRLRKTFRLAAKPVRSAIASATGLGFYELWLNGAKVDPTRVLAPGMTGNGALVDTYDVTAQVKGGADNTVGFWLAAGYSDDFSRYGWHWLKTKRAILHLAVVYEDGTRDVVVTDGSWEMTQDGEITRASIYNGETIDASRADSAWCTPAAVKTAAWTPVTVCADGDSPRLRPSDAPPVRQLDPRRPVRIVETRPGVFVADFGQNRAGYVSVRVKGPKGTKIRLHTSELVGKDGNIDPWTNGIAESTDEFILAGTGEVETFTPRFTYHGFQFVEITGWPGRPTADDLVGWAVHADLEPAGRFASSDPTLAKFVNAANWSMRSNFVSYPTDCCMRGERTPCQMDSQAYEDAALAWFQLTRYYEKWLDDVRGGRGNPDWTGDSVTLVGRLYRATGDARILAERYDDMKAQVDDDVRKWPDLICPSGFGDWCAPNDGTWKGFFNDVAIVNSAIFCEMCRTVAEAAETLGKTADATAYRALHAKAKAAFHAKFYHADTATYGDGSQTTAVLPLVFDIVPADVRAAVAERLVRTVREKNGGKVDVGIYGMRYLGDALCDAGAADAFVHAMTQPEYPGFGFMFANDATTLWEQWTFKSGMNTHNHAMFSGALSSLMSRLAGIRAAKPGFAEVVIQPVFPKALTFVEAAQDTPRGRVAVRWERKDGQLVFNLERPPFTPTMLVLPNRAPVSVASGVSRLAFPE